MVSEEYGNESVALNSYKHSKRIPRWNDVEMTVFKSFQREIRAVCL